jgi:hypothetical protein
MITFVKQHFPHLRHRLASNPIEDLVQPFGNLSAAEGAVQPKSQDDLGLVNV